MPTHTSIEAFSEATGFSVAMIKAHRITESAPHRLEMPDTHDEPPIDERESLLDQPEPMLDQP